MEVSPGGGREPINRGARRKRGKKAFFFEKKNQKTSDVGLSLSGGYAMDKSFLVLFFKKELLPCLTLIPCNTKPSSSTGLT
jgi:hypothetical protein